MKIEPAQGKLLAKKLMAEFKKKTETPTPAQVKSFATTRLGKLSMFIQPEALVKLVDSTMQDRDSEIKDMLRSTFANKNTARGKRCDVFIRTEGDMNLTTYTTAQVQILVNDGSLGCVPLKYLNMWIKENKLTFAKLSADALSPGQMRAMAQTASGVAEYQKSGGGLDLAKLPAPLMSAAGPSDIKATPWANLRSKLSAAGAAKLDKQQRAMVVFKSTTAAQVADADLGAEYTELVPVADLKDLTAEQLKMAAKDAPPDSPLRMLSADDPVTAIPASITASNAVQIYLPGLPSLDAKMVTARISTDEIQGVLEQLRKEEDKDLDASGSGGMSSALCIAMKKSLANATQLLYKDGDDDASILGTMTGAELGSLPPCIVGRMWHKTVGDKATAGQKMGILSSLSKVKPMQLKMMDKRNCHGLVRVALSAMKSSGDLTVDEASAVGMAATCLDGGVIKRLDMQAFDALRMHFRDGCIDKSQANAVVDQLIKYNGQPKTWTNLEPMCDLLHLMDDSRLREIPEKRLAAACGPGSGAGGPGKEGMQRFEKTAQMICRRQVSDADHKQMMERKMNVGRRVARGIMMAQKELMDKLNTAKPAASASAEASANVARRRRRRAADPKLTCAMVQESAQGADPWALAQLKEMAADEVKMCQKALGSKKANKDKLQAVWSKLKEAYGNDAGLIPMKDIGFVAAVIPTADIKKLDLSSYDAVSAVGQPMMMMSEEQLTELAKRAKSQFSGLSGEPTDYTADNLMATGQIICGMGADDVTKIPNDELKPVMKKLSEVSWCPSAVTEKLATKYLQLNGGDPAKLGKAEVAEMGAMIGGLEAMNLKKITNESMAGLTAVGMMSIPPNKIAVLTRFQVSQLSLAAANSVSPAQKSKMSEDVKTALDEVIETRKSPKSGAEHVTGTLLPLLLLALAVTRLA